MEFQVYQLFETTVKFHTLRVFNRVTTHIKNGIGSLSLQCHFTLSTNNLHCHLFYRGDY